MALFFIEGWDHYGVKAEAADIWTFAFGVASSQYSLVTGRDGSGQAILTNASNRDITSGSFPTAANTVIVGVAIKSNSGTFPASTADLLTLRNSSNAVMGALRVNTSGTLTYTRGASTVLGTTSVSISSANWNYIEVKVVFHGSTGTVDIQIDGNNELALTSQNTEDGTGGNIFDNLVLEGETTFDPIFDDIYIADASGTINNDFLGDSVVEQLVPDGAGGTTLWTIGGDTPAATNWQSVDDPNPGNDGTTTVVEENTASDIDLYTHTNLASSSVTVYGVQVGAVARKEDVGTANFRLKCDDATTVQNGATIGLSTTFTHYNAMFESRDGASTAWTGALVDGAEFGIEVIA